MGLFITYRSRFFQVLMLASCFTFGLHANAQETSYRKSTEGGDLVKKKIYPKRGKLELGANGGMLLNESYVRTYMVSGGVNYFFSEEWGFGLDIAKGLNQDKTERGCIENFYNNPLHENTGGVCNAGGGSPEDNIANTKANMGPAYVPIRELQYVIGANAIWNPIYGKALFFMSGVLHFDLFVEAGGGIASSTYYEKMPILRNGNESRGDFDVNGDPLNGKKIGAKASESYAYGKEGRPDPQTKSNVLLNLGVGQKFHFGKQFQVKVYLRNMTLLGTEDGFENLFALFGGLGMRF